MNRTRKLVLCGLFAAFVCVGAFVRIPFGYMQLTLQTLFVLSAVFVGGTKVAVVSVLLYLVLGLCGLPVFAKGGGFGYVLEPTFGYLLGFLPGVYTAGKICGESYRFRRMFAGGMCGILVIYFCGGVYFYLLSEIYLHVSLNLIHFFLVWVLLPLPGDILSCLCAAYGAVQLYRAGAMRVS